VPAAQCPVIADEWDDPAGVPIDASLFGGRRASVVPLVREAFDWQHGVFLGATMSSEKTAAATGTVGELRFDPFAMLPFCGYDMAAYFAHWLQVGRDADPEKLPRIFYVNWFRKDAEGKFLWPGYGENSRVLAWIFRRCEDAAKAEKTPIGLVPAEGELDLAGLAISPHALTQLLDVDRAALRGELPQIAEHLARFGEQLSSEIQAHLTKLQRELTSAGSQASPSAPTRVNGLTPTRTSTVTGQVKR
jgi:phosphoenolpyruvate carboxykinase (GTP)